MSCYFIYSIRTLQHIISISPSIFCAVEVIYIIFAYAINLQYIAIIFALDSQWSFRVIRHKKKMSFIFTFILTVSGKRLFLSIQVSVCHHISSSWRTSFDISCSAILKLINSLSTCLSKRVFIFPPTLKNIFIEYRNLDSSVFSAAG